MNKVNTVKKSPARKVTARKPATKKAATSKGLAGLTKAEQSAAINKAMATATIEGRTVHYNSAGYHSIPTGYKGAYTMAAFATIGLIDIKGALVTAGKPVQRASIAALLTSSAVNYWTNTARGYMTKDSKGLYAITAKGLNNLSGRADKAHAGRALTSYGIDGIVDYKAALSAMLAFITKGTKVKDCPHMVASKVTIK